MPFEELGIAEVPRRHAIKARQDAGSGAVINKLGAPKRERSGLPDFDYVSGKIHKPAGSKRDHGTPPNHPPRR